MKTTGYSEEYIKNFFLGVYIHEFLELRQFICKALSYYRLSTPKIGYLLDFPELVADSRVTQAVLKCNKRIEKDSVFANRYNVFLSKFTKHFTNIGLIQ
ncbi:MAG: hypothetical protein NT007_09840 [Candidatus Kapabacteria bacterium]|nr:hypothetical protein [Candidatus Kapabacteria bacterium]